MPLLDGDVFLIHWADVNLTRAADATGGVFHHFAVIGNPAGHTTDGEDDGEHLGRDAERAHDDAAVKIHVGIKFAFDEIRIMQRGLLERLGDVEQRVVNFELRQHDVAGVLDDFCARVVILVNAMAEAHELLAALLVLRSVDELRAVVAGLVNLAEHFEHGLIRAAVPFSE